MKTLNKKNFSIIAKVASNISQAKRIKCSKTNAIKSPYVIGLKLTNKCNLRCRHCYEWNDRGYHNYMKYNEQNAELDFSIIEKIIKETDDTKAMFYLWGGEPFVYKHIRKLLMTLAKNKRYVVICTNAILLPNYYDLVCEFDENIELLIALDGDMESNDALRGQGTYTKVVKVIKDLIELKINGFFHGKISIHTMISNENLDTLNNYVETINNLGIDDLILCLPWYISEKTSRSMDVYYFNYLSNGRTIDLSMPSWHAYKYKIDECNINKVHKFIENTKRKAMKINVQFQPDLSGDELTSFLRGNEIINCDGRECLTVYSRMDVLPTGKVTFCKHFKELEYGNLINSSIKELWNSTVINDFRDLLNLHPMPVCSKCNNLYRNSYKCINGGIKKYD